MKPSFLSFKKLVSGSKDLVQTHKIIVSIGLFGLALCYLAGIFYLYAWKIETIELVVVKKTAIDEELYQKIMTVIKQRETNFAAEESKTYADPFK